MGLNKSKDKQNEEEEAELKHIVKAISLYLTEHQDAVHSISHSVKTQAASVELLSSNIKRIVSVNDMKVNETPIDDSSQQVICCHCTTEWQKNANLLLCSVQSSLQLQSKVLCSTFQRLNKYICTIRDRYDIGGGTSVDFGYDRHCLHYEDSPKTNFEDIYREYESEIQSLKKSNTDLVSEHAHQLKEIEQRNETLIAEKDETLVQIQNKKKRLESCVHDLEEKSKGKEEKIKDMEEKLKSQEKQIKDMEEISTDHQEKLHDMEEKSNDQVKRILDAQNEIERIRAEKISLQKDMNDIKQTVTVQLFHNLKGGMIPNLLCELKKMLATQMQMKRQELQFVICQTETDVNPRIPVFVFCINASRLGTDAASAIQNLKVSSKVSILVFHHKDVHALPNQASDRVLTEPEFKELGGIFDIAFLADKGIYACDMNRATAVGIEKFLITQSQVMTLSR